MIENLWIQAQEFHGHHCPGLAIGVRVCEAAIQRLKVLPSQDEELVCVAENDACGVDAVQRILGCSAGKGNLIFRLRGKQAFSFFNRSTGASLRVCLKQIKREMERAERERYILKTPLDDLFDFSIPSYEVPEKARIFLSLPCASCGEMTAESMLRLQDQETLCLDCFQDYGRGLN